MSCLKMLIHFSLRYKLMTSNLSLLILVNCNFVVILSSTIRTTIIFLPALHFVFHNLTINFFSCEWFCFWIISICLILGEISFLWKCLLSIFIIQRAWADVPLLNNKQTIICQSVLGYKWPNYEQSHCK